MDPFIERNLDVLENLEVAIIEVYRADPSMIDVDAKDAVDALVRHYHAEEKRHTPPTMRLTERAERVFRSVKEICEWRLGRAPLSGGDDMPDSVIEVSVLVRCLRQIQKSIPRWTRQGGRKGYLDFVSAHIPG